MKKEIIMITAQMLRKQGWKIKDIAIRLGRSERAIFNYLKNDPCPRKIRTYGSKLNAYRSIIDNILQENPYYNRELLFERLKKQGYEGGITILRVYAAKKCDQIEQNAVIRFETEPGLQAQVDWKVLGSRMINGKRKKLYAFVMVLGYSRKPFVCFTTSMCMSVFLYCHIMAFLYFGGVPKEILYDNMKTAWICDIEGVFKPNKRLLCFAHHYGFVPRRCQIRRPQTKGKVERFIDYFDVNFMPRVDVNDMSIDELNEKCSEWIRYISKKPIRDLAQSRDERFNYEKPFLGIIPNTDFDVRESIETVVNRESFIQHETNLYSVPPEYIGKSLELLVSPANDEAEIRYKDEFARKFMLKKDVKRTKNYLENDKERIYHSWKRQFEKSNRKKTEKIIENTRVYIQSPSVYDLLMKGGEA